MKDFTPLHPYINMCQGGCSNSLKKYKYEGVRDCRAAVLAGGGDKSCDYGCLGYGTCAAVCPFGAITMNDNDMPVIDITKCTGCGICTAKCPVQAIDGTFNALEVFEKAAAKKAAKTAAA